MGRGSRFGGTPVAPQLKWCFGVVDACLEQHLLGLELMVKRCRAVTPSAINETSLKNNELRWRQLFFKRGMLNLGVGGTSPCSLLIQSHGQMEHPCALMVLRGMDTGGLMGQRGGRWYLHGGQEQCPKLHHPPHCGGFSITGPSLGLCRFSPAWNQAGYGHMGFLHPGDVGSAWPY